MEIFQDYIDNNMIGWLKANNLKYKVIQLDKGALNLFFNDKLCVKIYDRLGHGFSVSINIADVYDESIYENDSFNLSWAFKYFKIPELAKFISRTEDQYSLNLPILIQDIKNVIPRLCILTLNEWLDMKEWINTEAKKDK